MDSLSTIILVSALFIIMTGMGLSLTKADFQRVLKSPLPVFVGFLNQIILLPIIGYLLIQVLEVNTHIAIGTMILAACPGGPTSNLLTLLAKGDKALSVTLTAVNSLITIITIPLIVNFALGEFNTGIGAINAPIGKIAGALVVVIAVPLSIGMLINSKNPTLASKLDKPVRIASTIVLVLVIVGILVTKRDKIGDYFEQAFVIALCLNIATMVIGFLTAKIFRLNFKQALTISLESGNQNGTLAIHIAVVSLNNLNFGILAAVYSLIMYVTAALPVYIGSKKNTTEPTK